VRIVLDAAGGDHAPEQPVRGAVQAARELGCEAELDEVEALIGRGSGADEQVKIYEETDSLLAVAKWLNEETVRGL